MDKLYYNISETAEIIGESVSLIRYWSDYFSRYVHPKRNAKGNRSYTEEDINALKQIHYLVKECGMTLEGAAKRLQNEGAKVDNSTKIMDSLKNLRSQLLEIRRSL